MRRGWADDLRRKQTKKAATTVKEDLEEEEDCVILDGDPYKEALEVGNESVTESDEVVVVAHKGQIACRDYPHARHLCITFPFNTNPHEKYCGMCHCYVCDTQAPCVYWGTGKSRDDHCHSTDKEEIWRALRQLSKQVNVEKIPASEQNRTTMFNEPITHPAVSCSRRVEVDELREMFGTLNSLDLYNSVVQGDFDDDDDDDDDDEDYYYDYDGDDGDGDDDVVQGDRLTGTVKWFDPQKGYGFIIPDYVGEDLFVHRSSIKSEGGHQTLTEGETVEFQIDIDVRGRKKAINVSGPDGSFVQGASGSTQYNEPLMHPVVCCSPLLEVDEPREMLGALNSWDLDFDQSVVQADRLTGTVKCFNSQKGYGFIIPDNGGEDLFVHRSSIKSEGSQILTEGETVEFQIDIDVRGRNKAINVSGPGGSFVQATSRTTLSNEQPEDNEQREMLRALNSLNLYRSVGQGDRLTGTVKWFNTLKGYGFIIPDSGGQDLFVHHSSIKSVGCQSLTEGETVEFQIDIDDHGRSKAIDVVSLLR